MSVTHEACRWHFFVNGCCSIGSVLLWFQQPLSGFHEEGAHCLEHCCLCISLHNFSQIPDPWVFKGDAKLLSPPKITNMRGRPSQTIYPKHPPKKTSSLKRPFVLNVFVFLRAHRHGCHFTVRSTPGGRFGRALGDLAPTELLRDGHGLLVGLGGPSFDWGRQQQILLIQHLRDESECIPCIRDDQIHVTQNGFHMSHGFQNQVQKQNQAPLNDRSCS